MKVYALLRYWWLYFWWFWSGFSYLDPFRHSVDQTSFDIMFDRWIDREPVAPNGTYQWKGGTQ